MKSASFEYSFGLSVLKFAYSTSERKVSSFEKSAAVARANFFYVISARLPVLVGIHFRASDPHNREIFRQKTLAMQSKERRKQLAFCEIPRRAENYQYLT